MTVIGSVESVRRYPVKSMRGEELPEAFVGFGGAYGDRVYAFRSNTAPTGFPYLTGREQEQMLLYILSFHNTDLMARPSNLSEAEAVPPGATPVYPDPEKLGLNVKTPSGAMITIDDPRLIDMLRPASAASHSNVTLHRPDRAMTDCRPVSLFSVQTAQHLETEIGFEVDKRRFHANLYLDLKPAGGFTEDAFVGRKLRIGAKLELAVMDRDPRCKMITLDPDSAEQNPNVLRAINRAHDNKAGVYGAVLIEGTVRPGDEIMIID